MTGKRGAWRCGKMRGRDQPAGMKCKEMQKVHSKVAGGG